MIPTKKTEKEKDYLKKKYLIYGTPKSGKSTIISNLGDDKNKILFFATEAGHGELEVYKWTKADGSDPTNWDDFRAFVQELTTTEHDFKAVAIDTADNLFMWCANYVNKKNKVDHESDLAFGKGYTLIKDEFLRVINYLTQKGYGVIFVSHKSEGEVTKDGRKFTQVSNTLPNTAKKIINGLCDYIFYFHTDLEGNRVIRTKATESIEAGDRSGVLPETIPMQINAKNLKELLTNNKQPTKGQ